MSLPSLKKENNEKDFSEEKSSTQHLKEVVVEKLISSRYRDNKRPLRWEERKEGIDVILTTENEEIRLYSTAQQSPPRPGWIIILRGKKEDAFTWTLYGIKPHTVKIEETVV